MASAGPVRKAAVAGTWYPGDAEALAAEVESYLAHVPTQTVGGRLLALISPHAGLRYSGPVAAYGYSLLRGRSSLTVILVGPSHRVAFAGIAVVPRGSFATPFGPIPIDELRASRILDETPAARDYERAHREEHSLEMQLPFLAHLVADLRIVPVVMGSQSRAEVDGLVPALGRLADADDVVLVASSDLSHYHPAAVANQLDAEVVGDVRRFDAEGLMRRLEADHGHACGGGPIVAVMKAARLAGANRAAVLRYADSGDAGEHDKSHVVGYLSAALTATA